MRRLVTFDGGPAKSFKQSKLTVPRQRDLCAGIAALGDVVFDHDSKVGKRGLVKTELGETSRREWVHRVNRATGVFYCCHIIHSRFT